MSGDNIKAMLANLAAMGVTFTGDCGHITSGPPEEYTTVIGELDPNELVHHVLRLDRVGDLIPTYPVAGIAMCLACAQWCFLDREDAHMVQHHRSLPICHSCNPETLGLRRMSDGYNPAVSRAQAGLN